MIFDAAMLLSGGYAASNLALTGQSVIGAGSFLSTNTYDANPTMSVGQAPFAIGRGQRVDIALQVVTAPTAGTSIEAQLVQADDAALTSNVQVISTTGAMPIASLPAGTTIKLPWAIGLYPAKRYIGVRYVNVGAIAGASWMACVAPDVIDSASVLPRSGFGVA